MSQKLTPEQLNKIIAETQRLQQRREQELEPEEVEQILSELNLPPELADEAITQVYRRQALEEKRRRNKLIFAGIAATTVLIIGSGIFFFNQKSATSARVSVQQDRITKAQDNGDNLKVIERQSNDEVFYRVTLKDAPIGQKLNLACDWINPGGQVVKKNRYQTKEITTSVWDTQCKYSINFGANPGSWKVQISLDERVLSEENFQVK
ncbi:DUF3859 domain-containing protein [Aetokthonos hydrillicola Thurmond2011]|jgi:hypothetical protein|uniref:DUF3859 domain-containing protein n=1 Tax=Aetokthonos hydrillicola Thurmond2011 TaxID=2712845 RepID=A0AAP5IB79_9CYAN|nr:DUF3859 domain-containing protein [Aetokthonos hydrillicola]MBO3459162.1 DUF3859 domain-containing protein [Aetokthonos hydrillicola CCALA 1050]MBW4584121.1 DUF3859 domain-containing protein [Aetokthonos hydrillicola CCALA 1050]MDR9898345.1 DUF3859 domain-containing protein [Aetokthonos hydrillicola Thurmond2011]